MISQDRLTAQQQIYNFLRTTTIKYEPLAQYLNTTLLQKGLRVNEGDRTTWKYYLNMVGQYHAADTLMYVTSIDTHEPILFSPQMLKDHPRTRAAYLPGGLYYNRLCDLYPDQVDLIKSILFPVSSMEKAVTSDDLTLLNYGAGYLEEPEESVLLMKLHKFLEILKERWYFDFLDDEPYFHLTFWGSLPIHLAAVLMTGRVEHIKTPYVHSFDLWSALKAEGLDDYSDILNREKSMLLYQNIHYFKNNAGKQQNLDILAERLLSDLGIGVYGRRVVQQSEKRGDAYQLTPQLFPVPMPKSSQSVSTPIEIETISTIQSEILEKGLTDSNSAETVEAVERKLSDTRLNEYATKFLEIRPVAQNKPYAELLNVFLMETLLVSITQGYYTKPIEIREPLTKELIFLSPPELLALYNYAVHKAMGIEVEDFPNRAYLASSFLPEIGTPQKVIPYLDGKLYLSQVVNADEYLSGLSYDQNIQTPSEFSSDVTKLWLRFMDHHLMDQGTKLEKARHAYQYLFSLCHGKREASIELVTGYNNYASWLGVGGINFTNTIGMQFNLQIDPKEAWSNLADTIITSLIPINPTLEKFGNFTLSNSGFERLRQLFIQMCSYRVVFIQSDRETAQHLGGGKWSSAYGPDDVVVHSDFVVGTQVNTEDTSTSTRTFDRSPGVEKEVTTKSDSFGNYGVTTTTVKQRDVASHKADVVRPSVLFTQNTVVSGTLSLGKTAMVPQGIRS